MGKKDEANRSARSAAVFLCVAYLAPFQLHAADEAPVIVMIASRDQERDSLGVAGAVEGQLSDLATDFRVVWVDSMSAELRAQLAVVREVAGAHAAQSVFWVDMSVPSQALLYIWESTSGSNLIRSVRLEGESAESWYELTAVIVRNAVLALLEGGVIGIHAPIRPAPLRPAPPPEEPADRPDLPRGLVYVSLSYGLTVYAPEAPFVHTARLGAAAVPWGRLGVFAAYRIAGRFRVESELADVEIVPHQIEVGLSTGRRFGDFAFSAGAAFLVDFLTWTVETRSEQVTASPPYSSRLYGLSPFGLCGWWPTDFSMVYLAFSLDVFFNESAYVVKLGERSYSVVDPWAGRPYFQAGLAFSFL